MPLSNAKLKTLAERDDSDIDYSDIPELDEAFFSEARRVEPVAKSQITIRLDQDVLDWFRSQGKGYQTRMNAVLKAYMRAQSR